MRVIKKYVSFDGPEHAQWQKESAEDAVWDAEWNQRHGPVDGGASILRWSHRRAKLGDASEGTVLHLDDVKLGCCSSTQQVSEDAGRPNRAHAESSEDVASWSAR